MKTSKKVRIKASNDYEAIMEANRVLGEMVRKQPFCKHTVKVELSDGKVFEMWINPRWDI